MKKVINLLIISILLLTTNVYAQTPLRYQRTEENNYGVSKKWKITSNNKNNILRTPYVNADEKIYDFSNILTDEEEELLKEKIDRFRQKTNMEVVIVTDVLNYSNDKENEVYADDFYDYNDFGLDDKYYSGVLLFRNTYEDDPYYHMSTAGNAQLYYGQSRVDSILDDIYPAISTRRYYEGFSLFLEKLEYYYNIGTDGNLSGYSLDENGFLVPPPYKIPWALACSISAIITSIIIFILLKKNKMVLKATEADRYLDHKSIIISEREDKFISTHTTSYTSSSSSGGGGGGHSGGSSHSGSSGGGHGGGGRHG